ncbi:MAG: zinc ribbon domain-containing protein [Acholeplasmataceae bacterium]|nr:zinc ribbon domain-containing protein [Acholeplasmataceae bacterium]
MAYCPNCGSQVRDDQDVCLSCGKSLKMSAQNKVYDEQGSTAAYAVLGFFVPIVGLILYLIWKEERPRAARSAGKGALISVVLGVSLYVVLIIILALSGYSAY